MKTIKLTKEQVTLVDSPDFKKLSRYKWFVSSHGYAIRDDERRKRIYMHRFIMDAPSGMVIDHINGNGLDNRRENLRICTQGQNTINARKIKVKTSIYKGVYFSKVCNRWVAQIGLNWKRKYLGLYDDEKSAAIAYDKVARETFGVFANTNFK